MTTSLLSASNTARAIMFLALTAGPLTGYSQRLGVQGITQIPVPQDWQAYAFELRAESRVLASGEVATYDEAVAAIHAATGGVPGYRHDGTTLRGDGEWQVHFYSPAGSVSPVDGAGAWTWRAVSEDEPGRASAIEAMEDWISREIAQGRICPPPRDDPALRPQVLGNAQLPDGSPLASNSTLAVQQVKACYRELVGTRCSTDQVMCMTATAVGQRVPVCAGEYVRLSVDQDGHASCIDTRTALISFSNEKDELAAAGSRPGSTCENRGKPEVKPPSERELVELKALPDRGKVRLAVQFSAEDKVSRVVVLKGSSIDRVDAHIVNYLCTLDRKSVAGQRRELQDTGPGNWHRVNYFPGPEILEWKLR